MKKYLQMKMPQFHPIYSKNMIYGSKKAKERENLKTVLEESTEGYCMYCYTRIRVDGKLTADLEHAIEKKNSDLLIECIPNIGLSCAKCNQTYKKAGERRRRFSKEAIAAFEKASKCTLTERLQCDLPCDALNNLKNIYIHMPDGKIILQPMGVTGEESGNPLGLQYDVMDMEFQPAVSYYQYSKNEIEFIKSHINRFRLNDPKYKTRQLYYFVKNVVDNGGKIPEYEYNNWIVEGFRKQMEGKTQEEILKICKTIFSVMFLKV